MAATNYLRTWVGVLGVAALGASLGLLVGTRAAGACSCVTDEWIVRLRTATSTDPMLSHAEYWPSEADLTSYPGVAYIWTRRYEPGVISRAGSDESDE